MEIARRHQRTFEAVRKTLVFRIPGASSFVPAGLTAHIQYGAGSTASILRLMGATPTAGTKLKAPPISSPDGAFFCLIHTSPDPSRKGTAEL